MSETGTAPHRGSNWMAAIIGGLIGALLMVGLLLLAAPQMLGKRMVRDALVADPHILVEAGEALRGQQFAPVLAQYRKDLETPFGSSWKGSDKPDVTLVEFFDYACTYCKASNPHVERLIAEDPKLRVVYREFPILGQASVDAARLSMAASRAGRFGQFHDAMFAAGRPSPDTLALAAKAVGMPAQIGSDPSAETELKRNYQLAGQLGADGTPVFIVGDKVMNGAVGYETLKEAIAAARARKS